MKRARSLHVTYDRDGMTVTPGRAPPTETTGREETPSSFAIPLLPSPPVLAALLTGGLYGLVALMTADHYGVGWDNPIHFKAARLRLQYLLGQNHDLLRFANLRFYGPLTDLLSHFNYRVFHGWLGWLEDVPARHLHLYAFGGLTVGLTTWIGTRMRNVLTGLLAGALLGLYPVYLGFTHLAMKGIPLGSFYLLAAYLGYRWTETREWRFSYGACAAVGLGLACKLSVVGVVLSLIVYRVLRRTDRPLPMDRETIKRLLLGGMIGWLSATVVWPYLWFNPFRVIEPFVYFLTRYDWEFKLLYMGTRYDLAADSVPWHYPYVTLLIKSPMVHLVGLAASLAYYRPSGNESPRYRIQGLWVHTMLAVPLLITLSSGSFYYDADRQYLFLYPFLALGAALGWTWLTRRWRAAGLVCLAVGLTYLGVRIGRLHPHEEVFYNDLVGRETGAVGRYELDYYGNVYRQGCRWLNQNAEPGDAVHVPLMGNLASFCLRDDLRMHEYTAEHAEWAMILPRAGINPLSDQTPAAVIPSEKLPLLYIYRLETDTRERDFHRFFR